MTERQFLKLDLSKEVETLVLIDCLKLAFNNHKEWYEYQKWQQETTGMITKHVGNAEYHLQWMKFYKQLIKKMQLNLFPELDSGAEFSENRKHRFVLWRIWDETKPKVMFIGLNPSTANEFKPDNTITRIIGLVKGWGYGGFYMLNLFTYVTPYPKELETSDNLFANAYLNKYAAKSDKIIFAWGNFKQAQERARQVISMFPEAYCLYKNKNGSPIHPLYVKKETIPMKF